MNPENDWRFIHADTYLMYNLGGNIYNSSFPPWTRSHQPIFEEIRNHIGMEDAVIHSLILVEAGEYTVCQPIPKWSGLIMLEGEAYAAIYEGNYDSSMQLARKAMSMHRPDLNWWVNFDAFGFNVDNQKMLFPGSRAMSFYPKKGAKFVYFKIDDKYMERRKLDE